MNQPFRFIGRVIGSTNVNVTSTNVVYVFTNNSFASVWPRGLALIDLNQTIPTGTTGTLPVLLEVNGQTLPLTRFGGADVTSADITGTGIILVYFDRTKGLLQVVSGL